MAQHDPSLNSRPTRMGERSWLLPFPPSRTIRPTPAEFTAELRAIDGVVDAVVTDSAALVTLSPRHGVEGVLRALQNPPTMRPVRIPTEHTIAVRYDGPDLAAVADATGLTPESVVAHHTAEAYRVEFLGFMPGFAYLVGLHSALVIPRRDTPRPRIPPGSVAIAGPYSAIYPGASPGGWHLIGTAVDFRALHPDRGATLQPGDTVRFVEAR